MLEIMQNFQHSPVAAQFLPASGQVRNHLNQSTYPNSEKLTVEICQDPVKYDYSHSIRQLITAIPTLDKRWARAEKEFVDASNIPGVDSALIHRHANRIRLIIVELVGKMDYLRHLLGESHEKLNKFEHPHPIVP